MIGYFPTLYVDELLYSWFARYHDYSRNISPKRTMQELFNTNHMVAVLDLPSNLLLVHQALSHFNPPKIERLIQHHTLFGYYTFFQSNENRLKAFKYMKTGGKPGSIHLLLGITATTVNESRNMRFCPVCKDEDLSNFGETYWHLAHQLPMAFYCPIHDALLMETNLEIRNSNKHQYFSANSDQLKIKDLKALYSNKTEDILKIISRESYQIILNQNEYSIDEIQKTYKYLLQINGFANCFGNVNQQKLAEQFTKFYGQELLELMDSTVDIHNESCWLKAITRKHRRSFHPIRHILFMNFLGADIKSLKNLIGKEFSPFGKAPYYCLNPAADHYKKRIVEDLTITICTDTRKPVGTFKCGCGFIYSRRGPDKSIKDEYNIGRIKQFGAVWEARLKQLLNDGLSYYEIGKRMSCDIGTVKKHAISVFKIDHDIKFGTDLKIIKEIEWMELVELNSTLSVTAIRKLNPALYAWHYRNNREWLKANSPKNLPEKIHNKRVDWEARDRELLKEVKRIVNNLYSKEKPVFVNKTRVGKCLGKSALIEKQLYKLPRTKKFLEMNLETRNDFQIRRLLWSCNELYKKKEEISVWKIRKIAGFRNPMPQKIEIAIEMVLANIKKWSGSI